MDSIGTNTNNPKKKGKASRKDKEVEEEIISHADDYLRALEIFNQTDIRTFEISCGLLASSIKALIVTSVTNFGREYSAPLFVYPTWKPKIFPEVRLRFPPNSESQTDETDIDVVIQRRDGALFAFKSFLSRGHEIAAEILDRIGMKNETGLFIEGLGLPVAYKVVIGIEFHQDIFKFSFLEDGQNQTQPLIIEVKKVTLES